jgi:hypothetical protein
VIDGAVKDPVITPFTPPVFRTAVPIAVSTVDFSATSSDADGAAAFSWPPEVRTGTVEAVAASSVLDHGTYVSEGIVAVTDDVVPTATFILNCSEYGPDDAGGKVSP